MLRPEFNIYDIAYILIMAVMVVTNYISYRRGHTKGYYVGTSTARHVAREVRRRNAR